MLEKIRDDEKKNIFYDYSVKFKILYLWNGWSDFQFLFSKS